MKKICSLIIALLLMCSMSLTVPAYAANYAPNASDQISAYGMNAIPTSGSRIAIEFTITGAYKMAVIGAKAITVYEKSGSFWVYAGGFNQDDSGMTRTNAFNYGNTMYFSGESGQEYKVQVKVFAEDSSGAADYRSQTFYVTAN